MTKEIRKLINGMPNLNLERKYDYRDDTNRIVGCVHYLIGYLGKEEKAYKGKDIASLLKVVCEGKEWLEKQEDEALAYTE